MRIEGAGSAREYGYFVTNITDSRLLFSTCEEHTDLDTHMAIWNKTASGNWQCQMFQETEGCSSLTIPTGQPLGTELVVAVRSVGAKPGRVHLRAKESVPPAANAQCSSAQPLAVGQVTPGRTTSSVTNSRALPQCDQLNHNSRVVFYNINVPRGRDAPLVVTTNDPFLPPGTVKLKKTTGELWLSTSHDGRDLELVVELVVRPGVV